jgi:superoxide reductase
MGVDPALFAGINRVKDPQSPSLLEQKHAPVIRVPEHIEAGKPFAVEVVVGAVLHPMSEGHYIHQVELFAANEPAGRVEFARTRNQPQVIFQVLLDRPETLVAREYCNLHGLWESRRTVEFG